MTTPEPTPARGAGQGNAQPPMVPQPGRYPPPAPPPYPPYYPLPGGYYPGAPYPGNANPAPGMPYAPYGYPFVPGYGYGPPVPSVPPRRRDTYQMVVAIICTIALSLLLLGGVLLGLIIALGESVTGATVNENLAFLSLFILTGSLALFGGGAGLYLTIRALMGRPSAPLRLPHFLLPLGLTVAVFATAIDLYDLNQPQGSALLQTPLLLLSGIMAAITVFTLAAQRLGFPSTWRRVWLAFLGGSFLATIVAAILELFAAGALAYLLGAGSFSPSSVVGNDATSVLLFLLVGSVIAPLAEEGLKPLAPLVIIGHISGPAEAFLLGMASGIGFAIVETIGYIGSGQADWVLVAFSRLGAALLHGLGAGMGTLGWYFIFRGKGIARRYLKGFGAIGYALFQHSAWNGLAVLLSVIQGPVGNMLQTPVWLFGLPATIADYIILGINALLVVVLLIITDRLRHRSGPPISTMLEAARAQPLAAAPGGVA